MRTDDDWRIAKWWAMDLDMRCRGDLEFACLMVVNSIHCHFIDGDRLTQMSLDSLREFMSYLGKKNVEICLAHAYEQSCVYEKDGIVFLTEKGLDLSKKYAV